MDTHTATCNHAHADKHRWIDTLTFPGNIFSISSALSVVVIHLGGSAVSPCTVRDRWLTASAELQVCNVNIHSEAILITEQRHKGSVLCGGGNSLSVVSVFGRVMFADVSVFISSEKVISCCQRFQLLYESRLLGDLGVWNSLRTTVFRDILYSAAVLDLGQ